MGRRTQASGVGLWAALVALVATGGCTAASTPGKLLPNRCSYDVPCKNNGTCEVNTGYCSCMLGFGGAADSGFKGILTVSNR